MKRIKKISPGYWILIFLIVAGLAASSWIFRPGGHLYGLISDRDRIKAYIESWGAAAPLVFILFQILQVIIAPIPGEVSGFIGGYLFGAIPGLIFSTVGLTIGSAINFGIGRILGKGGVRRLIPADHIERLDRFLHRQGIFMVLVFFIFPGFPKDYLSLFLGITTMPFPIFLMLAAIGRIPGTAMLSVQGAFLYQKRYGLLAVIIGISTILVATAFIFREKIYRLAEKWDSK